MCCQARSRTLSSTFTTASRPRSAHSSSLCIPFSDPPLIYFFSLFKTSTSNLAFCTEHSRRANLLRSAFQAILRQVRLLVPVPGTSLFDPITLTFWFSSSSLLFSSSLTQQILQGHHMAELRVHQAAGEQRRALCPALPRTLLSAHLRESRLGPDTGDPLQFLLQLH